MDPNAPKETPPNHQEWVNNRFDQLKNKFIEGGFTDYIVIMTNKSLGNITVFQSIEYTVPIIGILEQCKHYFTHHKGGN